MDLNNLLRGRPAFGSMRAHFIMSEHCFCAVLQPDGETCACSGSAWPAGASSGQIGCDISMLEADGWSCLWSNLSSTPVSVGRSDISFIHHLITAEAQETGVNSNSER